MLVVLSLNVIWFGLAFQLFALRPSNATRMLVPREAREETSHQALVNALRFLGGMNLALAALSAFTLYTYATSGAAPSWSVFATSAVGHASQVAGNLPLVLRGGRSGGASWDVLRGPMLFIFLVDTFCTLANLAVLPWLGIEAAG